MFFLADFTIPTGTFSGDVRIVFGIVVGSAAFVAATITLHKMLLKPAYVATKRAFKSIATIAHEVTPNGGGSLNDRVTAISADLKKNNERTDQTADSLGELRNEMKASSQDAKAAVKAAETASGLVQAQFERITAVELSQKTIIASQANLEREMDRFIVHRANNDLAGSALAAEAREHLDKIDKQKAGN